MTSIDIHSGKLVEWVSSRFKMETDWADKIAFIREKISNALLDMPESEEIKTLLLGTYINYFHCIKILEILKGTESSSKNIFGQYSSQRFKDWQEIIKLYNQNNHYLIDCSQIINQFVSFDIPAIKKTIEKNSKTINDSVRKEKDYMGTINEAYSNLKNLFHMYSLEIDLNEDVISEAIRFQLKKSINELKPMLDEIEQHVDILRQPTSLYKRFVKASIKCEEHDCLSMLEYLLEKGNTTVYEWKYGKKPTVSVPNVCEQVSENVTNEIEISWDCIGVEEEFSVIDFGIELEGEQNDTPANETITILENHETREMLLDDLHELISFLSSCIDETKLRVGSVLDSIENIEEKWPEINQETIESMRNDVTAFMNEITTKSLVHLFLLKINPSYLDSILKRVEHEKSVILKYKNLDSLLKARVTEAAKENVSLEKQLETYRAQCIILKGQIENSISKSFNDRKVRIIGEINTI